MPKLAGINHQRAVKALEKAWFWVIRKGKHVIKTNGERIITIPKANPVNAFTMAGIVRDSGLTPEKFNDLL
jgi:predicted RNA binding protein YcfA (HicA-like mRNA interferase family)